METEKFGRRNFIKYGLISSLFVLSGCSISSKRLALRGVANTFPSEFVDCLSTAWKFDEIENIELKKSPYKSTLQEKSDLLVLNDGWISDLPYRSLKQIKADSIRPNLSKQASSFLEGLGEDYKNRIFPLAVSPWVMVLRNEDSLALKNKNSWEVIFSSALTDQIIFPNSPYLLISIAQKLGFLKDFSKLKRQAKSFDDRNALNWVVSGRARAAILPLSNCIESLVRDPRLSIIFPNEGSPLNWTVLASPILSPEPFPLDWFDNLWGPPYSRRVLQKGFFPPTTFSHLSRNSISLSQMNQSKFSINESLWENCWSLPILKLEDQKKLAYYWNNS